jgi:hypothetical protein
MPTLPGIYLVWTQGSALLVGEFNHIFEQQEAIQGISFPNHSTTPIPIEMASSARDHFTFDTLINVKLYLTGDPEQIAIVQGTWPAQGGGLFISYDGGRTYTAFSTTYGYEPNPTTWVTLPAASVGISGQDGVLGPFDAAHFVVKYVIPEQATQYQIYDISLTCDFDVS